MKTKKIITIIENPDSKGTTFKVEGFNLFEVIGLLTYYRDKVETDAMFPIKKDQEKWPAKNLNPSQAVNSAK